MKTKRLTTSSGFSLIELLAVVGIFLVIAAMAVPNMMSAVADFRLRSNVSSTAGLMQRLRMEAVRTNRRMGLRSDTTSAGIRFYADKNNNLSFDTGEYVLFLPHGVSSPGSGFPSSLNTAAGFPLQSPGTAVGFNARGLPCVAQPTSCAPDPSTGFAYYFTDTRPLGANAWAAITVSPSGRVRTWWWNGSSWQ